MPGLAGDRHDVADLDARATSVRGCTDRAGYPVHPRTLDALLEALGA